MTEMSPAEADERGERHRNRFAAFTDQPQPEPSYQACDRAIYQGEEVEIIGRAYSVLNSCWVYEIRHADIDPRDAKYLCVQETELSDVPRMLPSGQDALGGLLR